MKGSINYDQSIDSWSKRRNCWLCYRFIPQKTDAELTLFLRNAGNLRKLDPYRTRVIEGDVMDMETLKKQWYTKTLSMLI